MLNITEYLLIQLADECVEVSQRCHKALQFGIHDVQSGQKQTNAERLVDELRDLIAVAEMIEDIGLIARPYDPSYIQAKKDRVLKWMEYARQQGTLARRKFQDGPHEATEAVS